MLLFLFFLSPLSENAPLFFNKNIDSAPPSHSPFASGKILAKRQVEQDAKKAAAQAACVAKGLEEEAKKKAEMEQENAEAAEKGKQAMEAARIAAEAEKVRHKELSRSPPRDR